MVDLVAGRKRALAQRTLPFVLSSNPFFLSRRQTSGQRLVWHFANVKIFLNLITMINDPVSPKNVTICVYLNSEEVAKQSVNRSMVTCFRCGETGHYRAECHMFRVNMCSVPNCRDENCLCAHSRVEMRKPWLHKCVRVVKQSNNIQILGCGEIGHTYQACPLFRTRSKKCISCKDNLKI